MRVWLPIFPRAGDRLQHHHAFMSKRIMLPFHLKIYPLAILFEDAIILGAENDTTLYTSDSNSEFSLPFCSQVYLHQILRQLIRRNLGYHAYEIAISCTNLPYFPHSLELLLHEVLEEEATCKEPIPDAQLPSIIEFIQEFPVYLQTVVQCARKTEIALWPCLFSVAGKPKELFKQCLAKQQLDTAASYLIILQNLEPSSVSRQFATLLLDTALEKSKWELSRDLVRFLRAIDPNDIESPRTSFIIPNKLGLGQQSPPVIPNAEELSLILGSMQVARGRSFSTTLSPKAQIEGINANFPTTQKQMISPGAVSLKKQNVSTKTTIPVSSSSIITENTQRKKSTSSMKNENKDSASSAEHFFIDLILQRHARRLLSCRELTQLGQLSAFLDLPLVRWLNKERDRAARVDCFITALKSLHDEFDWPKPEHDISKNTAVSKNVLQTQSNVPGYKMETKIFNPECSSNSVVNRPTSLSMIQNHGKIEGDSGYMSYSGGFHTTGVSTPVNSQETISAMVVSPQHIANNYNDASNSYSNQKINNIEAKLVSQDFSSICSEQMSHMTEDISLQSPDVEMCYNTVLESISNQTHKKGSPKAEVQLRYLLQMFMEAGCLEWALIIAVILQDAMAVLRTSSAAKSNEQSIENVCRLRDGLNSICQWAQSECLGYVPFILAIQNQISVLNRLLSVKTQQKSVNVDKAISCISKDLIAINEQNTSSTGENVRKVLNTSPKSQSCISHTDVTNSIHGSQGTVKNSNKSIHTQNSFNNSHLCENGNMVACDSNTSNLNEVDVANHESNENSGCVIS
ncbi:RAB6A-GEF complex partner protein 1-like [Ctenocephalides felis]|uniref:RAB6A-GEF complex partner protein 1-like n=1 Tax=Ctenocephalides felis TaxID=7515 RepID=UPI000E6E20F9|nr:RAB6A-GEF complex partner protein 1-like [Ctenocephalides felis]